MPDTNPLQTTPKRKIRNYSFAKFFMIVTTNIAMFISTLSNNQCLVRFCTNYMIYQRLVNTIMKRNPLEFKLVPQKSKIASKDLKKKINRFFYLLV